MVLSLFFGLDVQAVVHSFFVVHVVFYSFLGLSYLRGLSVAFLHFFVLSTRGQHLEKNAIPT